MRQKLIKDNDCSPPKNLCTIFSKDEETVFISLRGEALS